MMMRDGAPTGSGLDVASGVKYLVHDEEDSRSRSYFLLVHRTRIVCDGGR